MRVRVANFNSQHTPSCSLPFVCPCHFTSILHVSNEWLDKQTMHFYFHTGAVRGVADSVSMWNSVDT